MQKHILQLVRATLNEDIGQGDLTAALIPKDAQATARLICREEAILCGQAWFDAAFYEIDKKIHVNWAAKEGAQLQAGQLVCTINGSARHILTAERSAINLLQTLSATATITQQYVKRLQSLNTKVLDTRKTIPCMRHAQKYATKIGGATNHRIGLFDGILIKENHIRAAGSITQAVKLAINSAPKNTLLEVEVEDLSEMQLAIKAGAKRLLLDNFSLENLSKAVVLKPVDVLLEASGNVTLDTIQDIAKTGVDYISVGAITKHIQAVDFSLQFNLAI